MLWSLQTCAEYLHTGSMECTYVPRLEYCERPKAKGEEITAWGFAQPPLQNLHPIVFVFSTDSSTRLDYRADDDDDNNTGHLVTPVYVGMQRPATLK